MLCCGRPVVHMYISFPAPCAFIRLPALLCSFPYRLCGIRGEGAEVCSERWVTEYCSEHMYQSCDGPITPPLLRSLHEKR